MTHPAALTDSVVPPRWVGLFAFMEVLVEPLVAASVDGGFAVEAHAPDGGKWSEHREKRVPLQGPDVALAITRAVASLAGATAESPDPAPAAQKGAGVYYVPAALIGSKRDDRHVAALAAIVLDIDDRDHGGREGTLAAARSVPPPTAFVTSGGGVQLVYVLREAVVFDRADEGSLTDVVRRYVAAAHALQAVTGADETAWPSHLFRCPGTYHLKKPERPVLVEVDVVPQRRFNLSDFDEFLSASDRAKVEHAVRTLVGRLLGQAPPAPTPAPSPPERAVEAISDGRRPRIEVPRRVSDEMVALLNGSGHPRYTRPDGRLDRSRAVYASALSLLGAGVAPEKAAEWISLSALRLAVEERGPRGPEWLSGQVAAARRYLAEHGGETGEDAR